MRDVRWGAPRSVLLLQLGDAGRPERFAFPTLSLLLSHALSRSGIGIALLVEGLSRLLRLVCCRPRPGRVLSAMASGR